MCKVLVDKIKSIFTVNVKSKANTNKKSLKISDGCANDNSVNLNAGRDVNLNYDNNSNSEINIIQNTHYKEKPRNGLAVTARWYNLVPHKKVQREDLHLNVLEPSESDYLKPEFDVCLDSSNNIKNAIYILINENSYISNLELEQIVLNCDTCTADKVCNKKILGLIEKSKSFYLVCSDFKIGNGILNLTFKYTFENKRYIQEFNFDVKSNSKPFLLKQYSEPQKTRK